MKHSKILNLLLVVAFITLFSCAGVPAVKPEIKKKTFSIVIEEDENLTTLGRQWYVSNVCFIKLKEYPKCLQHEVRHCIEGNWHEGYETDEDCFH